MEHREEKKIMSERCQTWMNMWGSPLEIHLWVATLLQP